MRPLGQLLARHRRLVGLAVFVALLGGVALPAQAYLLLPGPSTRVPVPSPVDPYSGYAGQTTCDPTAKPGARAVLKLAMDYYKVGRNTGITRSCTSGGQSEHKEGRAFDWGLSVDVPEEKAAGDDFTAWLTAEGPDGKPGYNARRLGVMYVIWNKQIWSSHSASQGWRTYNGPSPHTDHVHVSLSWNGAYMRTSWWTGSLVAQVPIGALDHLRATGTDVTVGGWALDPDTSKPIDVHVYVDGVGTSVRADRSRPDIEELYARGDRHGFTVTLPQTPGPHRVCVFAIDSDPKGNTSLGCRSFVVQDSAPLGAVDTVTTTDTTFTVTGWSLDPDTMGPNDVHVYLGSTGVAVRADKPRPDVGRAFGLGDLRGFTYTGKLPPGRHQLCVYAMNTAVGPNVLVQCRPVGAEPVTAAPTGALDEVRVSQNTVTVSGWTLDPDTTDPTGVEVVLNGATTRIRADLPRPDVAAALGRGDRRGFAHTAPVGVGQHSICVRALNTGAGPHTTLGCRDFTVIKNAAPLGAVDAVVGSAGTVTVSGWTFDPDTRDSTDVHIYVSGVGVALRADRSRPDVAAVFGRGDRHGFAYSKPVAPGRHEVCVYGIDTAGLEHRLLACRAVDVPR